MYIKSIEKRKFGKFLSGTKVRGNPINNVLRYFIYLEWTFDCLL